MSIYMETYDFTPELYGEILAGLGEADRALTEAVVGQFIAAGLPVKLKRMFPGKPNEHWRLLCFIKKSAEAAIVNTRTDLGKEGVADGPNVQLRLADRAALADLDALSEPVRAQIAGAGDCRFCSTKCEGKRYVFEYGGTAYTKCHMLCSNFRLTAPDPRAAADIAALVRREIAFGAKGNR